MADVPPTTGYEPKDLAENDDLCVKLLFFHGPSITSTYDSAESIATLPPESDLDDEQVRALLASPLYLHDREASADRSHVYHSVRENLVSSSSQVPKSTERETRCVVSKQKEVESRSISRQRRFFLRTSTGSWKQRTLIQILSSEKFCQIIPGRTQTFHACRSKI